MRGRLGERKMARERERARGGWREADGEEDGDRQMERGM